MNLWVWQGKHECMPSAWEMLFLAWRCKYAHKTLLGFCYARLVSLRDAFTTPRRESFKCKQNENRPWYTVCTRGVAAIAAGEERAGQMAAVSGVSSLIRGHCGAVDGSGQQHMRLGGRPGRVDGAAVAGRQDEVVERRREPAAVVAGQDEAVAGVGGGTHRRLGQERRHLHAAGAGPGLVEAGTDAGIGDGRAGRRADREADERRDCDTGIPESGEELSHDHSFLYWSLLDDLF